MDGLLDDYGNGLMLCFSELVMLYVRVCLCPWLLLKVVSLIIKRCNKIVRFHVEGLLKLYVYEV